MWARCCLIITGIGGCAERAQSGCACGVPLKTVKQHESVQNPVLAALPRPPLRVLFCHFTADLHGGSDRCLLDLALALPRARITAGLVLRQGDPLAAHYRAAGLHVAEMPLVPPRRAFSPRKFLRWAANLFTGAWQIRNTAREWDADVVHVNTSYNLQGLFGGWLSGRPVVAHVRELGDGLLDRSIRMLIRRLATRIVAISRAVERQVGARAGQCVQIHDGIDLSEYEKLPPKAAARAQIGFPTTKQLVLCVGRLETWKGQHVLVAASPQVLDACPESEIWIVGGPAVNKPEYAEACKSQAAALGVSEAVRFMGVRQDIPLLMAAADVLVLPTCTAEPFGRTVVEAMAAGCPVVATAAGGPLDTVADGFLVPPNDSEALAEKIVAVLRDPALAARMGTAGRIRAKTLFSLERHVERMTALFEEVAAEGRR